MGSVIKLRLLVYKNVTVSLIINLRHLLMKVRFDTKAVLALCVDLTVFSWARLLNLGLCFELPVLISRASLTLTSFNSVKYMGVYVDRLVNFELEGFLLKQGPLFTVIELTCPSFNACCQMLVLVSSTTASLTILYLLELLAVLSLLNVAFPKLK